MKKLSCLLFQVISMCMLFIYIVDKEKVGLLLNSHTKASQGAIQVLYVLIAMAMLFLSIVGFLSPSKPSSNNYKKPKDSQY